MAELKNLVGESALLAARRGHDRDSGVDFSDALEEIALGTVRGIILSLEERKHHPPGAWPTPGMASDGVCVVHSGTKNP